MKMPPDNSCCLRTALRILARRDHSQAELYQKLIQRGYPAAQISTIVERCAHLNYVNDDRFAANYALELQRKGYGCRRIEQKLIAKGLASQIVSNNLEVCCQETAQLHDCRKAMMKKLKGMGRSEKSNGAGLKLYRFLLNRGFSADIVKRVMADGFVRQD